MNTSMQDPKIMEDLFYAKKFEFSYSGLNKLLYAPYLFYRHYVLGERDEDLEKNLVEGKVIHTLLLDQDAFMDQFIIALSKLPSDNAKEVIEKIHKIYREEQGISEDLSSRTELAEFRDEILEELKEKNLYQKMSDELKINKIISEDGIEYFKFLKHATGRTIIDVNTYSRCVDTVEAIKKHECIKIMGMHDDNPDLSYVYNELGINIALDDFPFGLKGIIDNLYIDIDNKTIRINDIKTTSRTIPEFPETVMFYNYWMQAAIYMRLVRHALTGKYDDFNFVFSFIVVDKYNQVYAFEVSEETMTNWEIDLQVKLYEAKYHYEHRDYSLPYNFLKSKVML